MPGEGHDSSSNNDAPSLQILSSFQREMEPRSVFLHMVDSPGIQVGDGLILKPTPIIGEAGERQRSGERVPSGRRISLQRQRTAGIGKVRPLQGRAEKHAL